MRTVAVLVASTLPATSTERKLSVVAPAAEIVTEVPVVQVVPLVEYSVRATPEPPALSAAVKATVTGLCDQPDGALLVVVGATVSIRTVAVLAASTLPATSTERKLSVVAPAALMVTEVPVVQVVALVEYSVRATPEPPALSAAVKATVTGVCDQPDGALLVVVGAMVSAGVVVGTVML